MSSLQLADHRTTSQGLRSIPAVVSLAVLASASLLGCYPASAQSDQISNDRVSLSRGTVIPVLLSSELSSNDSVQGDTFAASIDGSKQAYNNIMQGATVQGVVKAATPQSGSDPGTLNLAFTSLRLADGRTYSISGSLTSMDPAKVDVASNGMLKAKNTSKNNRLTYAGIGAGAGALVSILGGGKLKIEDILLGGLAGYGVGSVLKSPEQVHDVDLKPGTPMGVLLNNSVDFNRTGADRRQYHETTRQGTKYYTYNGESWAMNRVTGERYRVSQHKGSETTTGNGKYYSYQGHPYYLNLTTGQRSQLD